MPISLLLFDDEQDFAETLADRLRGRGVQVETALDGESALERIATTMIDVVLLDVVLPGLDGIATLHKIKAKDPSMEVILLSGHADVRTAREGVAAGAAEYMIKPPEIVALMKSIRAAYRKKIGIEDEGAVID